MTKQGVRCWVSGVRKILFPLFLISSFILPPSSFAHTRLYACAIGSDSVGSSMGGSSLGAGLWQSDDTGKTWKQLGWKHVKCYSVDVVGKSNGKIIYQACGNGVLRSTDAGANWKMLTDWRITEVMDIAIDQKSPKNIYVGTPTAIWKSNDGGDNWFEVDSDIPYPIFVSRIKIDPKNHLKIYAATETGIYFSRDGGLQWLKVNSDTSTLRDFVINDCGVFAGVDSIGILVWRDTNLESVYGSNRNPEYHKSLLFIGEKNTFRIEIDKGLEISKNIHSLIGIDMSLFMGLLDGGVWKYVYAPFTHFLKRTGLETEQVWRLKAVEIK